LHARASILNSARAVTAIDVRPTEEVRDKAAIPAALARLLRRSVE
jgi:hypothetical protein